MALSPWLSPRVFAWLFGMMLPHTPHVSPLTVTGSGSTTAKMTCSSLSETLLKLNRRVSRASFSETIYGTIAFPRSCSE